MSAEKTPQESAEIHQILSTPVSLYRNAKDSNSQATITLSEWLGGIKNGCWREQIDKVRAEYQANGKTQAYRDLKASTVPGVTVAGKFKHRDKEGCIIPSGVLFGDIDELSEGRLSQAIIDLKNDPHVLYLFRSPSDAGLKFGIPDSAYNRRCRFQRAFRRTRSLPTKKIWAQTRPER